MKETQIIFITIQPGGTVDVQVRGSELSPASYGKVIGTAVRITADMFATETGQDRKEFIRLLLKEVNKAAHSADPLTVHSASVN